MVFPRLDHHERQWIVCREVLMPQVGSVGKGLATPRGYMPVKSPGRLAVVETGPRGPDNNLVGIFRLHCLIEIAQILLSPVTAVCRPPVSSRAYPGVEAIECVCVRARQV